MVHILRQNEKLHHIIIQGETDGRKPSGRPRNIYISQLKKKGAGVAIYTVLNRLAEDRVKWRAKFNIVNKPHQSLRLEI